MPGLIQKAFQSDHSSHISQHPHQCGSGVDSRFGIWSRPNSDDVNMSQLHKFWSELPSAARHELLRIDKQTLLEQVRKNLYCSRCNGFLLEGYLQIVHFNKNLQEGIGYNCSTMGSKKDLSDKRGRMALTSTQDDARDPSVHPWGGLVATRDSMLTVLDCFLDEQPLEVIQNVFNCARARERERELLYPDACGGGGRGWFSQAIGNSGYGRGHCLKETCALHTARLSCEALVDFWSALGDETRKSLLRMKEEDFIERLMFRFDSKRFCRDCRRNVLKEFKELKELKRSRKEPRCTRWFCTPDTAFRYEVSDSSAQVDWKESFAGEVGSIYYRFEWGIGSAEGKSDILNFEDVGLSEGARMDGLDFGNLEVCFITLRAWKRDGRCTELSVKAHALKGQLCLHRRLVVGDGYVSITRGESIKRFFERAEETEEDEDDDVIDKDGSEPDNEGSRLQKHAKSPELAREFLVDAANVIFKDQVEKAFREGTARQNAHSIFICLALSLLEERIHVACKDISTLEKQNKLLEEEEDEKREEEQRRERKRLKEKERKQRRKAKLKGKEQDKEKSKEDTKLPPPVKTGRIVEKDVTFSLDDGSEHLLAQPSSPEMMEALPYDFGNDFEDQVQIVHGHPLSMEGIEDIWSTREGNGVFIVEQSKAARRRSKMRKGPLVETASKRLSRRSSVQTGRPLRSIPVMDSPGNISQGSQKYLQSMQSMSKPERSSVPKWIEGWNRRSQYRQDYQHHVFQCVDSSFRVKARQNHAYRVGRDSGANKKIERSHLVLAGAKHSYRLGNSAAGSLQFKSDILKGSRSKPACVLKIGDTDQQLVSHTPSFDTIENYASSTEVLVGGIESSMFENLPLDLGAPRNKSLTMSGRNSENSRSLSQEIPSVSGISFMCLEGQGVQSASSLVSDETGISSACVTETSISVACPCSELLLTVGPENMMELPCSDTALDGDFSSFSATSCITDASDCFTVESMISETPFNPEVLSPLHEGIKIEHTPLVAEQLPDPDQSESCNIKSNLETTVLLRPVIDMTVSESPMVGAKFSCPERAGFANQTVHVNEFIHNHDQGIGQSAVDPNFSTMDMVLPPCHVTFPLHIPGKPPPPLPLPPLQHFNYYQTQAQWTTHVGAHLLSFPPPNRLLIAGPGGFGLPTGGYVTSPLVLPSPFQPFPQVLGFGQLPAHPTDSSFEDSENLHVPSRIQMDSAESISTKGLQYSSLKKETRIPTDNPCSPEFTPSMDSSTCAGPSQMDNMINASGFSFFHFGGPTAAAIVKEQEPPVFSTCEDKVGDKLGITNMPCRSVQQQIVGMTKMSTPMEEYSLFAATPGNRFGFF